MIQQDLLFDGVQLKELGQQQVLTNAGEQWKDAALDCILNLANSGNEFTSDDIRGIMDKTNPPHNGKAYGAILSSASKKKIIKKTGRYVLTKIPTSHARMIAVWERYK